MDDYYERLNQAFANWNGGEPSLDDRVAALESEMLQKQDIISDLSEIRSGAAAGATAVQQTTFDTDQARQETEIGAVANAGAKNVFKNTAVSKTYQSVTFTVNDDGTVSLSGTATTAVSVLEIGTVTPPAGSYIVSGCPAGGSWSSGTNKYRISVAKNGAWAGDDIGNGHTITVNGSDTISLQINSGVGVDTAGLVFKPMIRRSEITDDTFVPYAPTNRELYETKLTADGVWGLGTELSANTDLNVVTDIGRYFCTGASVGATLENCPTVQPFVLTVSVFQDVNNKIQRIESLNLSTLAVEIYERMKVSSGWKSWYKFEGTAVT